MHRTLAFLLLLVATPAQAMCSEGYLDKATASKYMQQALATLKAGPDGACYDRLEGERVFTTPAFDREPPTRKKALLEACNAAMWAAIPQQERERLREESGAVASPLIIVDAAGRLLLRDTACDGDYMVLTEHQRYTASFSISYTYTQQERPQTHGLRLDMKRVKQGFHGVMSWKPEYFIAWAPEGGFFEIDVPDRAAVQRLSRYWPKAPRGYRYEVRLNDGTLVDTVQR